MRAGPVLICIGPDAALARTIAGQATALLAGREAVVLCAWAPPRLPAGADDAAQAACGVLGAGGWTAEPRVVRDARAPAEVALDVSEEIDARAIVVGARETLEGMSLFLGRETRALAHHSSRPLLVVPPGRPVPDESAPALLAYDSSSGAACALDAAVRLLAPRPAIAATAWDTRLASAPVALVVGGAPDDPASLDDPARDAARDARAGQGKLDAAGWPSTAEAFGTSRGVWPALVDLAELRDAAVVVTGTRAHVPTVASLIGSIAEGVLRHAARPVLLVPFRAVPAGSH